MIFFSNKNCVITWDICREPVLLPPDAGEKIGLAITILLTLVVFLQVRESKVKIAVKRGVIDRDKFIT